MARGDRKTVRWANDRQKKKKEREKKKLAPFQKPAGKTAGKR
jgi:hypothetical protein